MYRNRDAVVFAPARQTAAVAMTPGLRWPAAIVCTGALVGVLAAVGMDGPVRVLATLFFLLVCTGMAYVPLCGSCRRSRRPRWRWP